MTAMNNSNAESLSNPSLQTLKSPDHQKTLGATIQQVVPGVQHTSIAISNIDQNQERSLTQDELQTVLRHATTTHGLVLDWVRSFDAKIGPLLTAAGALSAATLAVLGQQATVLTTHPATHILLAVALMPLLFSLLMAVSTVSPSLKWGTWGSKRHQADQSSETPNSRIFFGQIKRYETAKQYAEAATEAYLDGRSLLNDLFDQTHTNSKIAVNKAEHIALSASGLFIAIALLFLSGVVFAFGV